MIQGNLCNKDLLTLARKILTSNFEKNPPTPLAPSKNGRFFATFPIIA